MAITNAEKTEMVMTNNIMVEGRVIYVQQYTINSDDPCNFVDGSHFDYGATPEDKNFYIANKSAFRAQENAFEDKVFAKIAEMKNVNAK